MKRKWTSILLTLAMAATLLPAMGGTARAAAIANLIDASTGEEVDYSSSGLLTGHYYLKDDVTLSEALLITEDDVWLDLCGHKLIGASATATIFLGGENAQLNITDSVGTGTITHNSTEHGVGVHIGSGTFNMYGGMISSNTTLSSGSGGGVYVNNGAFNMYGGEIAHNTATNSGGGVYVNGGTFAMYGGTISGNKANSVSGGGVCVGAGGTFDLYGGTISGNSVSNGYGGGVYNGGTFNMYDGVIAQNMKNESNDNVYAAANGTFTWKGGTIKTDSTDSSTSPTSEASAFGVAGGGTINKSIAAECYISGTLTSLGASGETKCYQLIGNVTVRSASQLEIKGDVWLDLNGYSIVGASDKWSVRVDNATLNLVDSRGHGTITHGDTGKAHGVAVLTSGHFNMYDGIISGNTTGVYTQSGTFVMYGGKISGNMANSAGGGVFVNQGGTFTMHGGTISGNAATSGGGVYVGGSSDTGSFTMYGGTITGNRTTKDEQGYGNGGGVNAFYGTFTMYGGTISNNTATRNGGGVEVKIFTMSGGTISNNTASINGGGVFVDGENSGTFNLSGNPTISGNEASGAASNVYLFTGTKIAVTGALNPTAPIGVTKGITGGVFTSGAGTPGGITAGNLASIFVSEQTGYSVVLDNGEAKLAALYAVIWKNADGTVLKTDEAVVSGTTPSYDGETPTKAADAQYTYTFTGWDPTPAAVTGDATYKAKYSSTVNQYTVTFVDSDGTTILKAATAYDYGTAAADIVKPADPAKAADAENTYAFAGWSPAIATVTGDATYTATYAATPKNTTPPAEPTVTVSFDANGGAGTMPDATVARGSAYTLPANGFTAPSGKTFANWRIGSESYRAGSVYTVGADTTVAAVWTDAAPSGGGSSSGRSGSSGGGSSTTTTTTPSTTSTTANADGSNTTATAQTTTRTNADGSKTATTTEHATTTTPDGARTETSSTTATTTKTDPDGTTTATTTASETAATTAADGVKTTTETRSETTEKLDRSGSGTVESKTTETVKDENGDTVSTTVTERKGTVETASDGTRTTTTTNTETTTTGVSGETSTTVTAEKTIEMPDGTTGTTISTPDGATLSAEAAVSERSVSDASGAGAPVTLPVAVKAAESAADAAPVAITLPADSDSVTVEIPVENLTPGTVAVLVNADGTEEIIRASTMGENGVVLTLDGGATVKIVDNTKEFSDVPAGEWYADAVTWAASREVMNGTDEGTFVPNADTSRGMAAQILYNLDNAIQNGADVFSDVISGDWFYDSVAWANEEGVITGFEDGTFRPDENTSREQLAAMLYRYARRKGYALDTDVSLGRFADARSVSDWAETSMRWAVGAGVIVGDRDGSESLLNPQGDASRAQIATMMKRFCEKVVK